VITNNSLFSTQGFEPWLPVVKVSILTVKPLIYNQWYCITS
jgi:hypothetical protein